MEKIILYSNHCPQCKVLASVLNKKQVQYEEINDIDLMLSMGLSSMPVLQVGEELLRYKDALDWANKL